MPAVLKLSRSIFFLELGYNALSVEAGYYEFEVKASNPSKLVDYPRSEQEDILLMRGRCEARIGEKGKSGFCIWNFNSESCSQPSFGGFAARAAEESQAQVLPKIHAIQ
eukprot:TRINITY_DN23956_c0_g2_i2.p1 TRINITY_DN23956_c0_g2~~TRINITY_DN23956_c0_g2_i2.p1  ORF type:complete len:109 (+),score=21.27 TRINITY_DN23956_c0_g2_i2:599-925(+)